MRTLIVAPVLATLLLGCSASVLGQPSDGLPLATEAAVDSAVAAYMAQLRVPGLALAVVRERHLHMERGYGLADVENLVPVRAVTVFPIASISKSITAVAALQLAERGLLDLDAPVQVYVPEFPEKRALVTPEQLLRHTSGVRHYRDGEGEYMNTSHYESITESLEVFSGDSLLHAPGAAVTYSSYGYTLLGAAIEGASGMTFPAYLERHLFTPAGMDATRPNDVRQIIWGRSEGYAVLPSGELVNAQFVDPSNRIPGGGLLSTAGDMARFTAALLNDRLLSPASYALMTAPTPLPDGPIPLGAGWALGTAQWLSDREARPGALWSGGNILGSTSIVYVLPDDGVSVSILTNLQDTGTDLLRLAYDIAELVREGG